MPRYITKDGTYYIPNDVVEDFERDYPDAKVEYEENGDIFHVPIYDRENFLKEVPNATLTKTKGETLVDTKRRILYDHLINDNYDLPDYETFSKKLDNEDIRKALYDQLINDNYDLGDYETFSQKIYNPQPNTEDRIWLYGHLKDNGYEIGTQEEFETSLDNSDDDAEWYYQKALDLGLEVGSYDDFVATFRKSQSDLNTAQEANLADISVAPLMGISDVVIIALAFVIGAVGSGVFFKVRKKESRGIKYLIAGVGVVILLVLAYLFALNNRYYVKDAGVYFDKWTKTMYVLDDGNFKPIEKTR